jgi:hypothetical protein
MSEIRCRHIVPVRIEHREQDLDEMGHGSSVKPLRLPPSLNQPVNLSYGYAFEEGTAAKGALS